MNRQKQKALLEFADIIANACPRCGRRPGALCDTEGVWVHYERLNLFDPQTYTWDLAPL